MCAEYKLGKNYLFSSVRYVYLPQRPFYSRDSLLMLLQTDLISSSVTDDLTARIRFDVFIKCVRVINIVGANEQTRKTETSKQSFT